jgi:hypothetical protein
MTFSYKDFHQSFRRAQRTLETESAPITHIVVGSMARFARAVEERTGPMVSDPARAAQGPTFAGVPVEEHKYLPDRYVVLRRGAEVAGIIDLDKEN